MSIYDKDLKKIINRMVVNIRDISINPDQTVICNINTINGYFKRGALYSYRLNESIDKVVQVNNYFLNSRKIFINDCHDRNSIEFDYLPQHCFDDYECSIIDELGSYAASALSTIICKNSSNGFLSADFIKLYMAKLLDKNLVNFVIIGGYTDIDILQFSLSLSSLFIERNLADKKIYIVENAVQTYDSSSHNGDIMHNFALYNMLINKIDLLYI